MQITSISADVEFPESPHCMQANPAKPSLAECQTDMLPIAWIIHTSSATWMTRSSSLYSRGPFLCCDTRLGLPETDFYEVFSFSEPADEIRLAVPGLTISTIGRRHVESRHTWYFATVWRLRRASYDFRRNGVSTPDQSSAGLSLQLGRQYPCR